MSAALVRQALEFVDPDESKSSGKKKRGSRSRGAGGQAHTKTTLTEPVQNDTKSNNRRKSKKRTAEEDSEGTQEVISKLLKLSKTTANKETSREIVKRAVAGKPVFDIIEVKKEVEKSILFPDDEPKKKKKNKKRH